MGELSAMTVPSCNHLCGAVCPGTEAAQEGPCIPQGSPTVPEAILSSPELRHKLGPCSKEPRGPVRLRLALGALDAISEATEAQVEQPPPPNPELRPIESRTPQGLPLGEPKGAIV